MPESTPAPKRAKTQERKSAEVEKTSEASGESTPEAVYGLEAHALSVREQLMRQWPSQDYERRG